MFFSGENTLGLPDYTTGKIVLQFRKIGLPTRLKDTCLLPDGWLVV
ncbi:hypothetical protein JW766_06255 [Candidatus Dojkabacteria bacterium]|nr:hypothetical protein [Candidatus Dojkabacteria bacterium]